MGHSSAIYLLIAGTYGFGHWWLGRLDWDDNSLVDCIDRH